MPQIGVLGASGLIGEAVSKALEIEGFGVVAMARRFTLAQLSTLGTAVRAPLVDLPPEALARLLADHGIDVVVNCIGVLQDSRRSGSVDEAHRGFVERLVAAVGVEQSSRLLIHLSIPGHQDEDRTPFSRSKRQAERIIGSGSIPFIILRPGFVVAAAAYGGSAFIRALSVLPFDLPQREASSPLATTDVSAIAHTIAFVAQRWSHGERAWNATWDVMEDQPSTVGEVIAAFRTRLGGPTRRIALPAWSMTIGAKAGDVASRLGWSPPIRTTALDEMRRGVRGDPAPWTAATSLKAPSLHEVVRQASTTIQERWFGRLYLLKALAIATLALFWIVSGVVALTAGFHEASSLLVAHGFTPAIAPVVTIATGLADVVVGAGIAVRRFCRRGLLAGLGLTLTYIAGATVIAPAMWLDPLGSLVKTGPALILMLIVLAILDDR